MKWALIPDFKRTFTKLWSVRLGILAGALSGAEVIIPLFQTAIPRGVFAGMAFTATMAALIARGIYQESLHGPDVS